jgi:hypothetical protein
VRRCLALLSLVLALTPSGVGAEPATTIRAVDLKARAASDAKTIASLPANANVDLVRREGAWVQLRSGKELGWAKLFDIRLAGANTGSAKGGSNSLGDVLGLASGQRGASVTTGVRGLDEDMLRRAQPNPAEFDKLASYASAKEQVDAFLKAGNLHTRTVEFLK